MLDKMINELHLYEKKLLKELSKNQDITPEEIAENEDMPLKAVTICLNDRVDQGRDIDHVT